MLFDRDVIIEEIFELNSKKADAFSLFVGDLVLYLTMKNIFYTFVIFASLTHSSIKAQQAYLTGIIKNEITQQPIEQSSLKISDKQIGTVSNADGKFMLLYAGIQETDSLKISCMGYQTKVFSIANLQSNPNQAIYLKPVSFNLTEVAIHSLSIPEILKKAIDFTDSLIPVEDNLGAYYKEFAYLDEKLYKYADAAVQYKIDHKDRKTKLRMNIVESRIKKDSVTEENKWKSEVETLISPDQALKDYYSLQYLNKLVQPKQLHKYTYTIQSYGDLSKITVNPKTEVHQYLPNAVVYINTLTNRVMQVEYGYLTHLKYMPKVNLIFIAYSCEKNSMLGIYSDGDIPLLRYCRVKQDIRFKLGKKQGLLGSVAEVLIHNNNVPEQTEKGGDSYKKSTLFRNGNRFSDDFWYKYNTILPTGKELKILSL
ncbi:carboxypeptidase-like regulatory domain-containing protein [Pedobacter sp. AW31-3R]|uniref:carboxypeptidase-like regulatory domain-containing protein n=1 Tax=Pedobacter sp. AW31-3R TaxID=3445781 RepID=UPI003F9F2F86